MIQRVVPNSYAVSSLFSKVVILGWEGGLNLINGGYYFKVWVVVTYEGVCGTFGNSDVNCNYTCPKVEHS